MAQVNFRIDDTDKARADALFEELGLNMTTAITAFIKQALRERAIPFQITAADPFYSKEHLAELERRVTDMRAGRNVVQRELAEIEDTDDDGKLEIAECGSHYGDK